MEKIYINKLIDRINKGERTRITKEKADFIQKCFKYGAFIKKPTKEHKEWFKRNTGLDYPIYVSEITEHMKNELYDFIKSKEEDEIREEEYRKQRYKKKYADIDVWDMKYWFMEVVREMLIELRDNTNGYPNKLVPSILDDRALHTPGEDDEPGMKKWKQTLNEMVFLINEMDEKTCSIKNPYDKEVEKAEKEFAKKYGFFGERFEEINGIEPPKNNYKTLYTYSDDPDHPEWKELKHKHCVADQQIWHYRDRKREEFFNLFSKNFWDLWD